jgi:hypothetical protein
VTHITKKQLARIKKLLKTRPQCRLVSDVEGIVTCDGYAFELESGGVIHPLSFLDIIDSRENKLIDILKKEL